MMLSERILSYFSRDVKDKDFLNSNKKPNVNNALELLSTSFSKHFMDYIKDRKILDFGCGSGWQSTALILNGAKFVLGLDINQKSLNRARNIATKYGIQDRTEFKKELGETDRGKFEIVISQNSFEHFPDPLSVLDIMKIALNDNGRIYTTFGPPWFSPYGSHMHIFTKVPWVNILFSEETVMTVRSNFRGDGAQKYEDIEGGLNKMTVKKFENIISASDLNISYKNYRAVKGLNFLSRIPILRELFINHVSCILEK